MNKKMIVLLAVLAAAVLVAAAAFGLTAGKKQEDVKMPAAVQATAEPAGETVSTEEADAVQEESAAQEEEMFEIAELYGTVIEIADGYLLLESAEFGKVQANISDDTMIEGVESIEIGQVAKVIYDGKMTRSIPAQIGAMLIGVYSVSGEVTQTEDGRITLKREDNGEEVILTLPQDMQAPAVGDMITAYTTGVSTMSLPPQMNAVSIVKAE